MYFLGVVIGLGLLAFVIYQVIGVVKDIKKNRQKKKDSIKKIEKEKTE